jgi:cell division protein FtsB
MLALWIAYLGYGAVMGAVGYRTLAKLEGEADALALDVDALRARRLAMQREADLLHPQNLDKEMVEERIRSVLGYVRAGDMVVPRAELDRFLATQPEPLVEGTADQ